MSRNKTKLSDTLISILIYSHIISWVLFTPISQFQMMIFGSCVFTFVHFGILEMAIVFLLICLNHGQIKLNITSKRSLIVSAVFLVSWVYNFLFNGKVSTYNLLFYLMTWLFPFIVVFITSQYKFDRTQMTRILHFMIVVCIIHAVLIFIQRFTNSLIWPYLDYGDGEQVFYVGENYYTSGSYMARCPGLAISGLDAGILLLFGIVVLNFLDLKKTMKVPLYVLFVIAIFFTGTRNVYVITAYVIAVTLIVKCIRNSKTRNRLLVLITVFVGVLYFYFVTGMTDFNSTRSIFTDNMSIMYRLTAWERAIDLIHELPFVSKLFGILSWQQAGGPLIDNFYLETIYCSGIISLVVMIFYIVKMATACARRYKLSAIVSAAFILSFFIYGVLNSMSNFYLTLMLLIFMYWRLDNTLEQ